jgi:hypothetical protein
MTRTTRAKKISLTIVFFHIFFKNWRNFASFTTIVSPFIRRFMFMPGAYCLTMSAIAGLLLNMFRACSIMSGFARRPETEGFCIIDCILEVSTPAAPPAPPPDIIAYACFIMSGFAIISLTMGLLIMFDIMSFMFPSIGGMPCIICCAGAGVGSCYYSN